MNAAAAPVLVAYDGSDPARRAIREAAGLFGSRQALVVTVWEPALDYETPAPDPMGMSLPVDPDEMERMDEGLQARAERTADAGAELAKSVGLQAEALAVLEERDIADAIAEVARSRDVAVIVIGSRGLSGLRARLEGSTSNALLKRSPCPVLVVHDD
jgi:nucleotide-binding universal stress UspA family protein